MDLPEIKSNLIDLSTELENKKNEIKNYLTFIDTKINQIQIEIAKIDQKEESKTIQLQKQNTKYQYTKNLHEYDSDDLCDRIYLMDLPKLFPIR
jgi:hypothetical protein